MKSPRATALLLAFLAAAPAPAQAPQPLPVHVGGRAIAAPDGSLTFGWPAVYVEGRFRGTAISVSVETADDRLQLLVDGTQKALLIQPGSASLTIAGLAPGDHVVRLEKVTESQSGGSRFFGFTPAAGSTALPPAPRARQIEFIGDSYTVGYGNLSHGETCTQQQVHDLTDSQQAFGPLVARALGADYRVNAFSGYGVVRNYNGTSAGQSLPLIYPRLKPDDATHVEGDRGAWQPQVIVINLGTNDWSTPLHTGEPWADRQALAADYRAKYIAFARTVMARQPQAHLILMGSDLFYDQVQQIAATLNQDAKNPVVTLHFGGLDMDGCHHHLSTKDDRTEAAALKALLEQHADYWGGAMP
ncbi:SGNH/GDSL hydrolase family protein [Sphingomonas sp.]|uniref:SGNH/GDSL hydrolase family protein n=1 Tax=Sphingomonas sp. TaxID=28214 RepID=UPI003B3AF920